ncbi:13040_t:CDS:1, partial [Funneliformis geosporum]
DLYLELDQKKLKKATALHFQTVAGSLNKKVTDPTTPNFSNFWPQWEEFY